MRINPNSKNLSVLIGFASGHNERNIGLDKRKPARDVSVSLFNSLLYKEKTMLSLTIIDTSQKTNKVTYAGVRQQ